MPGSGVPTEFADASDGTSIAFRRYYEGSPVVLVGTLGLTIRTLEAADEPAAMRAAVPGAQVVTFDPRGVGLSGGSPDFSLEALCLDLAAVVRALEAGPVVLNAMSSSALATLQFAAACPELVSGIVLESPRGESFDEVPSTRAMRAAFREDWDFGVLAFAGFATGGTVPTAEFAAAFRRDYSPEAVRAFFQDRHDWPAVSDLGEVTAPTVIVERPELPWTSSEECRRFAQKIPGARLITGEGSTPQDPEGSAAVYRAVNLVLGAESPHGRPGSALQVILFTDLVGSTAMHVGLGDVAADAIVRKHDEVAGRAITRHRGDRLKHTGDGVMAKFASAVDALQAAQEIVAKLKSADVAVRVGLNAGEPIERDGDLFGTTVQLAARLCEHAGRNEIAAARVVADLAEGKGFEFTPVPDWTPKGFDRPVASLRVSPAPLAED